MRNLPPPAAGWIALLFFSVTFRPLLRSGEPVLEVTSDTTLDPAKSYGRIVIRSSGVTLDGRGGWLVGGSQGDPKDWKGVAIEAQGVSRVTLRNLNARGWETGLHAVGGSGWTVEGCNFSDNFTDPRFGWGEHGRRGGMVLERINKSVIRKNRANRVWDGLVLVGCEEDLIEENDFSHTSDTCLKLWTSSRNSVRKNNLSYGIRIDPGEVHARDSTSVLIESGSNDNKFLENDCTHGGDGIFVRILNGWVCTGNRFEGNDCSYANNNAFEAWSPGNTYVRNKANHSSYGFWLGASDRTVLLENEAAWNGDPRGFHNSPHLPGNGHAGIVFMFGSSSHTIARGNHCHHNNGAGIALVGDQAPKGGKWKAFHWIIEENRLEENRWGIYAEHADFIDLAANDFHGNQEELKNAGDVTNLARHQLESLVKKPPRALLEAPSFARVNERVTFDASGSGDPEGRPVDFRWDLGDGARSTAPRVEHLFQAPGFYRVALTVNNGLLSDMGWRDFYVVEELKELGTEGQAADWDWMDPGSKVSFTDDRERRISGSSSLFAMVEPYSGGRVSLLYPRSRSGGFDLSGKSRLVFWVKGLNENVPAWQGPNPVVTLYQSEKNSSTLTPEEDLLTNLPYPEAREGWAYFTVPLEGGSRWKREGEVKTVNYLTIGFDSWGAPPLRIWLDGLAFK
jgi:parallel beta-helix repeat protein